MREALKSAAIPSTSRQLKWNDLVRSGLGMLLRFQVSSKARTYALALALCTIAAGCGRRIERAPTLTLVGFGMPAAEELKRDALDEFTRSTGTRVNLVPAWGSSAEQLAQTSKLLGLTSNAPDVYLVDIVWPGTLDGSLLDLAPSLASDARAHWPALLENDTVRGHLVALPLYMNVGMLYYRTDLLKKYGYSAPPATWDELESMARRIQHGERAGGNPDFWGFVWQGAAYEGLTCDALEWQKAFGGGRIIESDGAISIDNPRAARALLRARSWIGSISPPSVLSYTESDSLAVFRTGNAAFLRHWSGALSPARMGNTPIGDRYRAAPLPNGPYGRGQVVGGFHLAVGRHSAFPRESVQLVRYLTGLQVQTRRAVDAGYLPTEPSLYQVPEILRVLPIAADVAAGGEQAWVLRPSTVAGARYAEVSRAYYQAVHEILSSRAAPAATLAALEQTLVRITGFHTAPPRN